MYDHCIFDLDGTLTDPKVGITNAYQRALAAFGIHEELDSLARFIGPPLRDNFRVSMGLSESDTELAVGLYREYYSEKGLLENYVYPGIPEALQRLKDHGKTLTVATNKITLYSVQVLEHFKLDGFFECISGDAMDSSLSRNGKRDIINIAIDAADPERKLSTVMIGDRMHDITGARDAGIDSIGITWGYGSRSELENAGATWIADTPEVLCEFLLSR